MYYCQSSRCVAIYHFCCICFCLRIEYVVAVYVVFSNQILLLPSQMQVVTELKTEQDPNCSEPDVEGVSPPPVGSQTPMDADKQAIYR